MIHNIFNIIDSEEKAYWLGFLYADGCVLSKGNRIQLDLHIKDYDHVKKFAEFVQTSNPIAFDDDDNSCRIRFSSIEMRKDLINLGCVPRKSLILKFPSVDQVPSKYHRHFLRGYNDGDGCISIIRNRLIPKYPKVHLIGTKEFLQGVMKILGERPLRIRRKDGPNTYYLTYNGTKAVEVIKFMYENSTVYLARKHTKYLEAICYKAYQNPNPALNHIWITNGSETRLIHTGKNIPSGWVKGLIRKNSSTAYIHSKQLQCTILDHIPG